MVSEPSARMTGLLCAGLRNLNSSIEISASAAATLTSMWRGVVTVAK
jgi:hypothetical protein